MKVLVTLAILVSVTSGKLIYPGTTSRPILSDPEAALFTKVAYLQGWTPPTISTTTADYTVGTGGYSTIQAAVNDAIKAGGTTRKYIKITEGVYNEIVYIPNTNVPITLYGEDIFSALISFDLSATISGSDYANLVGTSFKAGDPAYSMYSKCASSSVIGSDCTSVVWVRAPNVQIINLTIRNAASKTGASRAVALYTEEDNFQVESCRLLGYQGTFYAGTADNNIVTKGHVTKTYIEGDVDFVFGGGSIVFEGCIFYALSNRTTDAVVFAPATAAAHQYGFLVIESDITGDSSYLDSQEAHLARAWDYGLTSSKDYVAGTSPNGQLVVRESFLDPMFPYKAPYLAATSGRPYSGNNDSTRDVNNPQYNRFWEYAND